MAIKQQANALIHEVSPYLLQHAHNPIHWYSWSDIAFKRATVEDKPIFLSIGYSTCHWCHVMAHESFEDEEVAQYLNEHFISIKVDREERPDIDSVYMKVCQLLTGQGGWPLTILMTPNAQPFYAGTYFPKNSQYHRPGLMDILKTVVDIWNNDRQRINQLTTEILDHLNEQQDNIATASSDEKSLNKAFDQLKRSFDEINGGFGEAPKFPTPHKLMFLLRYYAQTNDEEALHMVTQTLQQMYKGGLFDHLGFGFSRYSTDEEWLVPHFEKMLYDNALLAIAYLEAFEVTEHQLYLMIAKQVLDYVGRNLSHEAGGFYCAEDADSEGEEGKYYLFTPQEIISVLNEEALKFNEYFNVTPHGNFEGRNILNRLHAFIDLDQSHLTSARQQLLDYRESRYHLHKDDKVLTSWNGLMIVALAKAYHLTQQPIYLMHLTQTICFINEHLIQEDRLYASYCKGQTQYKAYLDDYAFYIYALIESYLCTFVVDYLEQAMTLTQQMLQLFKDREAGGFFLYGQDAQTLIIKPKETFDGAIPSGNSVTAYNLIRLATLVGDFDLQKEANEQLAFMSSKAGNYESYHVFYLMATQFAKQHRQLIAVLSQPRQIDDFKLFISLQPLFNTTVILKTPENAENLEQLIPDLVHYPLSSQANFYVCEHETCHAPVHTLGDLKNLLERR